MSSPLARPSKSVADLALIAVHQRASHGQRIRVLAKALSSRINELIPQSGVKALDVGCGDMSLADAIALEVPQISWVCADIHPCSAEKRAEDPRWSRYVQFDGSTLPFMPKQFDVVTFSDVLHHVPEDQRTDLLRSAASAGKKIVIKDHFEYGFWSRQTLRAMDFVGNFGYGVSVPRRYFSKETFEQLCDAANVRIVRCDVGIRLYEHLPFARRLLSPRWQFIAVCEARA